MGACTVQRLRLGVPSRGDVVMGTEAVRSTLRRSLAALDDQEGQLLVRHLDLGVLRLHASSSQKGRDAERVLEQVLQTAVWIHEPLADEALAVRFRRREDALVELVLRACATGPLRLSGWFWPILFPALRSGVSRSKAIHVALTEVCTWQAPWFLFANLLDALVSVGRAEVLLDALSESQARELLQTQGVLPFTAEHAPARNEASVRVHAPAPFDVSRDARQHYRPLLARYARHWGSSDARRFLLCCAAYHEGPRATSISSAALAWAAGDRAQAGHAMPVKADHRKHGERIQPVEAPALEGESVVTGSDESSVVEALPKVPSSAVASARSLEPDLARDPSKRAPEQPYRMLDGVPTDGAGLLFAVPILSRLGLAEFLEQHPALARVDLGRRILCALGREVSVPAEDPLLTVLTKPWKAPDDACFTVPSTWRGPLFVGESISEARVVEDPSLRVGLVDDMPVAQWRGERPLEGVSRAEPCEICFAGSTDAVIAAWLLATHRWLGRFTRLSLETLILRRALLSATRTHLDLSFHLDDADAEVRRPALDLNPGYVKWLGQVVTFHYLRR